MEPGDIVIGKPVVYTDYFDGVKTQHFFVRTSANKKIKAFSHKEAYLSDLIIGLKRLLEVTPGYEDCHRTYLLHTEVRGMVVDFDSLNSKRPHVEGLAAVLINDKVWWILAGDLQVIKLGQGKQ